MEPSNNYQPPTYYPQPGQAVGSGRQVKLMLNILIVLTALACGLLLFLILDGYGKLSINLPGDTSIQLNGHAVATNTTLRLRPGNYQVLVSSPLINPYQGTVHVGLLKTTAFAPKLQQRDPAAIIDSAIGSAGAASAPPAIESTPRWFHDNTWLGGVIEPGNSEIALHYDSTQKQWVVSYYNGGGYPTDLSKLPQDVAAYVTSQEKHHAGG